MHPACATLHHWQGKFPSERVFSEIGIIYDKKRSRLTGENAEKLFPELQPEAPKLGVLRTFNDGWVGIGTKVKI